MSIANALPVAPGQDLGASPWIVIGQADIDAFAAVTRDQDPMHVDPQWCREQGPFPHTIAFGFLSLSLLTHFSHAASPWPEGYYWLNYGFDRVRFIAPVPVDARIRGRFKVLDVQPRSAHDLLVKTEAVVEVENEPRPALVAEWLGLMAPIGAERG